MEVKVITVFFCNYNNKFLKSILFSNNEVEIQIQQKYWAALMEIAYKCLNCII